MNNRRLQIALLPTFTILMLVLSACGTQMSHEDPGFQKVLATEMQNGEVLMARLGQWFPDQVGWQQSMTIFGGESGARVPGMLLLTKSEFVFSSWFDADNYMPSLRLPIDEITAIERTNKLNMPIFVIGSSHGVDSFAIADEGEGAYVNGGVDFAVELISKMISEGDSLESK